MKNYKYYLDNVCNLLILSDTEDVAKIVPRNVWVNEDEDKFINIKRWFLNLTDCLEYIGEQINELQIDNELKWTRVGIIHLIYVRATKLYLDGDSLIVYNSCMNPVKTIPFEVWSKKTAEELINITFWFSKYNIEGEERHYSAIDKEEWDRWKEVNIEDLILFMELKLGGYK